MTELRRRDGTFPRKIAYARRGMRSIASPFNVRRRVGLEDDLAADLANTSRRRVGDLAELAAVRIAHRSIGEEVGVVEDVEKLDAQVKLHSLGELGVFLHTGIRVYRSRPVEEELLRAACHATLFVAATEIAGKGRCIEVSVCRSMRVELLDRSYLVRIVKPDVGKSKVAGTPQAYGCASVEAADAGNLPSLAIPVSAHKARKREIPVVAGHEVMPQVERRLAIVTTRSARVIGGRVSIERLGVRIREQIT